MPADDPAGREARMRAVASFVRAFAAADRAGLRSVLAPNLTFEGPYLCCSDRESYIEAVCRADDEPTGRPEDLQMDETGGVITAVYRLVKPGKSLVVHQKNRFDGGLIAHIEVAFDPAGG